MDTPDGRPSDETRRLRGRVAELETQVKLLTEEVERLNAKVAARSEGTPESNGFGLTDEEAEALRQRDKLRAIQLIRRRTNLGLVDAKNLADRADPHLKACGTCGGTGRVTGGGGLYDVCPSCYGNRFRPR